MMARTLMSKSDTAHAGSEKFTAYQTLVIVLLGSMQLLVIGGYWVIAPTGMLAAPMLTLSPAEFGTVISAYGLSAGIAGLLSVELADRFDRKKLLLALFSGFIAGIVWCGLADTFATLLMGRVISGLFGGALGSAIFSIAADFFFPRGRGRLMALGQAAFPASQVLSLPAGLLFPARWTWQASFLALATVAAVGGVLLSLWLQPIAGRSHKRTINPLPHLRATLSKPVNLRGVAVTALVTAHDFLLIPLSSVFAVRNLGVPLDVLAVIFVIAGLVGIAAGVFAARASHSAGIWPVFLTGHVLTTVVVLTYANLEAASLAMVTVLYILLFVGIFVRLVPFMAIVSSARDRVQGDSVMAVNAGVQHLSAGIAGFIAGDLALFGADGELPRFDVVGYALTAVALLAAALVWKSHVAKATETRST